MSRSTTKSAALTSAQNLVRGAREPWIAVSQVRERIPSNDVAAFVRWMPKVRGRSGPVTNHRHPKRLEDFWTRPALAPVSLAREVAWIAAQMVEEAASVERFLELKLRYERALCRGSASECFATIDVLEDELGFSFWSIEARIGALQMLEGLEAQKNHLAAILKVLPGSDAVSFVAYHVSRRVEPSTFPTRFADAFARMTSEWDASDGLAAYLDFRLADIPPQSAAAFANVLRHETPGSLVDQYETFVALARFAATVEGGEVAKSFDPAVARVALAVDDERLAKIMLVRGRPEGLARLRFVADEATEAALGGEIERAAEAVSACVADRPNDPVLWRLLADLSAPTVAEEGASLDRSVPRQLRELLSEDPDGERQLIPLLRLSIGYPSLSFTPSLLLYAWKSLPSRMSAGRELEVIAFIERAGARADEVALLPAHVRGRYLEAAAAALPGTRSLTRAATLAGASTDGMPALSPRERFRAEVDAMLIRGDARAALKALLPHVEADDPTESRWAAWEAVIAMSALKEHAALARFVVAQSTRRPGLVRSLPVAECIAGLDEATKVELRSELTLSIILDLAAATDDGLADARAYAYEDFLISNGLDRPSQLDVVIGSHDRTLLVYYLRHLCVPEIMQVSSEFQSTRELQEERIAVLRLLVEIDADNAKVYEDELREVTRTLLVHSGVRHVGQTKIFVDVPALRRWAERNLREDFSRFRSHLEAGLGIDRDAVATMLHRLALGRPVPAGMLELPKNEATDLLVKMTVSLYREFLTNPDHGLDCYLSMRIRHGTLAGQLRTPLEVEHLITQRRAAVDEYTSNERWTAAVLRQGGDPGSLDRRFADFSREYDSLIAEVSNELIQVRSEDRPAGLFDPAILRTQLLVFSTSLTSELTFDGFLDLCFDMYWSRVDVCLTSVREVCNEQLKPRIARMFNSLEAETAPLAGMARSDLETAIRSAATGANQALDIVADWFRLPAPIEAQVFPIEAMIDVGLKCVTTIYPEFHPDLRQTVKPALPPFRDALAFFSDVFFIVFDNIRRHSGLTAPTVDLMVEESGPREGDHRPRLCFRIESDMKEDVGADAIEEKLERIRRMIEADDYRSAVTSEGGTGLIKLHRILGRRNLETDMLDFGFKEGRFVVDFRIFWRETSM